MNSLYMRCSMPTARKTSLLALSSRTHCRTVPEPREPRNCELKRFLDTPHAHFSLSWPAGRKNINFELKSLLQEQEEDERTLYL